MSCSVAEQVKVLGRRLHTIVKLSCDLERWSLRPLSMTISAHATKTVLGKMQTQEVLQCQNTYSPAKE